MCCHIHYIRYFCRTFQSKTFNIYRLSSKTNNYEKPNYKGIFWSTAVVC